LESRRGEKSYQKKKEQTQWGGEARGTGKDGRGRLYALKGNPEERSTREDRRGSAQTNNYPMMGETENHHTLYSSLLLL